MIDFDAIDALREQWDGREVEVVGRSPELARFAGLTGEVISITCNRRALVDFGDRARYDLRLADLKLNGH